MAGPASPSIPARLRIKGRTWRIYHAKRKPKWATPNSDGTCDPYGYRIWVRNTGNAEEDHSTLCHEVLHTLTPCDVLNAEFEEFIVTVLEGGLYGLLADNDWAFMRRG